MSRSEPVSASSDGRRSVPELVYQYLRQLVVLVDREVIGSWARSGRMVMLLLVPGLYVAVPLLIVCATVVLVAINLDLREWPGAIVASAIVLAVAQLFRWIAGKLGIGGAKDGPSAPVPTDRRVRDRARDERSDSQDGQLDGERSRTTAASYDIPDQRSHAHDDHSSDSAVASEPPSEAL